MSDGRIELIASQADRTLQYSYRSFSSSGIEWLNTPIFDDLNPLSAIVRVRNADGTCEEVAHPSIINIRAPEAPIVQRVFSFDLSDCNSNDGRIQVQAAGGSGDLQYRVVGGEWQDSPMIRGLSAGSYQIQVSNKVNNTCITNYRATTVLTQPTAPELDILRAYTECGTNLGTIEVLANGGNESYQYVLDDSENWSEDGLFSVIAGTTHDVYIANNDFACKTLVGTITVPNPRNVTFSLADINIQDATDCLQPMGSLNIIGMGRNGMGHQISEDYEFRLNDQPWQQTFDFIDLPAGDYTISARTIRGASCQTEALGFSIEAPSPPSLETTVVPISDCGRRDGQIILSSNQQDVEYRIEGWQDWSSNARLTALPAGNYSIQVRTAEGHCEQLKRVAITAPSPPVYLNKSVQQPTPCATTADGQISIAAEGQQDLEYSLDGANWQSSPTFADLGTGEYEIFLRNADGKCLVETGEVIAMETTMQPVVTQVNKTDISCTAMGRIEIEMEQTEGFEFSIDAGANWVTSPVFEDLMAQEYYVAVRNLNRTCLAEVETIELIDMGEEPILVTVDTAICQGETYAVGGVQYGTSGVFQRTLFTANGCDSVVTLDLKMTSDLSVLSEEFAPAVNTENNGIVKFRVAGGTAPYQVSWDGPEKGGTTVAQSGIQNLGGFSTGNYTLTVVDRNGCSIEDNFLVNARIIMCDEPMEIGGDLPKGEDYCYLWSPEEDFTNPTDKVQTPNPVEETEYTVVVTSEQGNIIEVKTFTVVPSDLAVEISSPTTACEGSMIALSANPSNLATYEWTHQASGEQFSGATISVTKGGTYELTVTDENGCTLTVSKEVETVMSKELVLTTSQAFLCKKVLTPSMPGSPTPMADPSCENSVNLTVSAGFSNYQWSAGLQDGANKFSKTANKAGMYSVTATDENGCNSSASVTIVEEPYCLTPEFDEPSYSLCGEATSTLRLKETYASYKWSTGETGAEINDVLAETPYAVTVTDAGGCQGVAEITIPITEPYYIVSPEEPIVCENETIAVEIYGDYESLEWADGSTEENRTFTYEERGEQLVTFFYSEDCSIEKTILIKAFDEIEVQFSPDNPKVCNEESIEISVEGSFDKFQWEGLAENEPLLANEAKEYQVTLFKDNCTTTKTLVVGAEQTLSINITAENGKTAICKGESITLTAAGGENYIWSTDQAGETITVRPTEKTTYTLQEYSNEACLAEATIEIDILEAEAPEIMVEEDKTIVCSGENVRLFVQAAGTYQWGNGDRNASTEVVPTETTTYSLLYTDENNCSVSTEKIIEVYETGAIEIKTESEELECEFPITLSVENQEGAMYEWSSEMLENIELLPESNRINALKEDTYSVTVTDANGCVFEDELVLERKPIGASIREKLEERGFFAMPVTITSEPPTFTTADPRNPAIDCETLVEKAQACAGEGAGCVFIDDETLQFEIDGSPVPDIKALIEENLAFFAQEAIGYEQSKAFVTTNETFCCTDYCNTVEEQFEAAELAYWVHLWRAPEGEQDMLYVLANIPCREEHSPQSEDRTFLIETLSDIKDKPFPATFKAKSEQDFFTTLNILLADFQEKRRPPYSGDCYVLGVDEICIAPSGQPIVIKAGSKLEYFTPDKVVSKFDSRALVNFTEKNEDGEEVRYKSFHYLGQNDKHQGYRLVDTREVYDFNVNQIPEPGNDVNLRVLLGEVGSTDECALEYVISKHLWKHEYELEKYSAGPFVTDFSEQVDALIYTSFASCLPDMEGHEFAKAEENARYNPFGRKGFLFKVEKHGAEAYVYGFEHPRYPDVYSYLFWDNGSCGWREYPGVTEDERETMHFLDALIGSIFTTLQDSGHDLLDVVGMVPIIGELADGVNGIWYLAEGNKADAALSFVALVPLAGSTATGSRLVLKLKNGIKTISKPIKAESRFIGKTICVPGRNRKCNVTSLTSIVNETIRKGFTDDQYALLIKKLLDDPEFLEAFKKNPGLVNAWHILEIAGRKNLKNNLETLKSLDKLIVDTKAKKIFGDEMIPILLKFAKFHKRSFFNKLAFKDHLELLTKQIKKYEGVQGYNKSIIDAMKTANENVQDGFWHMIKDMDAKNLPKDKIKKVDMQFDGEDLPCTNCKFDLELDAPDPTDLKFLEYKSYKDASKISKSQFLNYLTNINSIEQLNYVFSRSKLNLDNAQSGMKAFLKNNELDIISNLPKVIKDQIGLTDDAIELTKAQIKLIAEKIVTLND